jgi:peroxiredoxin
MSLIRPLQAALLALFLVHAGLADAIAPPQATRAPDFTLRTSDGRNVRLEELHGKVVLLNFWATWCGPCREEMPRLQALYDKYRGSGLVLLGVNIDDNPNAALAIAQKLKVSFPVLLDTDKSVSKRYDLSTMPSTVLIDRDGQIRYVHRGYRDGDEADYDSQVRAWLRKD